MNIKNAIRIEAIYDKMNGHLGCALSHIKALEYAKQNNWKRFMILEDDFIFNYPKERFLYMFDTFLQNVQLWDVFLLGYQYELIDENFTFPFEFIKKINRATTTIGYVVNNYTDSLLENFYQAVQLLETQKKEIKIKETPYAIDRTWIQLQQKDSFYITIPRLGKSNNSFSSIMN
jgi:hypothetical protein